MSAGLRQWPRRRWITAGVAFPVLAVLFAVAGTGSLASSAVAWWTWPWLILTSAAASVVVASYLAFPGNGKIFDVGCSPCAAVAGLALGAALVAHSSAPASPVMATAASALTVFALRQRLTDAGSCPAPSGPSRLAAPAAAAGDQAPTAPSPASGDTGSHRDADLAAGDGQALDALKR